MVYMQRKGFLWGAATSAHQVEGNNTHSDWWMWERKTQSAARSGKAVDHYNRFAEDFALAKQLGHNAHRFSIEWARIEPAEGKWNMKALDHYKAVLQELHQLGITPLVTLHHFTLPAWLMRKGGWVSNDAVDAFARYADVVAQHLGKDAVLWTTINEPMVYALNAYWQKKWLPHKRNIFSVIRVLLHMAAAHRKAYRILHRHNPTAQVGIAKHAIAYMSEHSKAGIDRWIASLENWWFNYMFFTFTGMSTHDFIGINYYFPSKKRIQLWPLRLIDVAWKEDEYKSDVGWPIEPKGLEHVLTMFWHRYKKPMYITENGVADWDDSRRPDFIRSHLRAIERAQQAGVDVRGYFHWSLLDNFEWEAGFWPRFGLIEIDYETLERKPRASAYVYKAIIEQAKQYT